MGGTLSTIHGTVEVGCYDFANVVTVTVDDSGNGSLAPRDVTFRQDAYGINVLGLTDDPNGDIVYNLGATSSVTVLGGAGNTAYHLQDFLANTPLTLTAGGGTNTLDYSAATGNVYVNLNPLAPAATDLAGFSNIQSVVGASGGPAGSYNILVGAGGDVLTGGNGRSNLLVAGGSASTLTGGDSGDILIAGTTDYDTDAASLRAIMAYWTGADDFATRVANLEGGNAVPLLNAPATVHGNGGGNTVTSNGSVDLIFANLDLNPDMLN